MRARIDITEIEAETKIRAKYLRALENEEWDLLPGPDVRQELPAHLRRGARASTGGCWSRSTSCATSACPSGELRPIAPPRRGARRAARQRAAAPALGAVVGGRRRAARGAASRSASSGRRRRHADRRGRDDRDRDDRDDADATTTAARTHGAAHAAPKPRDAADRRRRRRSTSCLVAADGRKP